MLALQYPGIFLHICCQSRVKPQSCFLHAGLSVAAVDSVDIDTVVFRGADVVDGTPVLDIKPYIPYVDGGVRATAPEWVLSPHAATFCCIVHTL